MLFLASIAALLPLAAKAQVTDAVILNFALFLENLENNFYMGLSNFTASDFPDSASYQQFQTVAYDEAQHVAFLTKALTAAGATPLEPCTYSFPYTTATEFVALSNVLENVGVSAYLGAAGLITDKDYLTAAGSILTIEARHSSFVQALLGLPIAEAPFDTPLGASDVYTLAAQFVVSCPSSNGALPFKAFPLLNITSYAPGEMTSFSLQTNATKLYATFYSGDSITTNVVTPNGNGTYSTMVPADIQKSQIYVVVFGDNTTATASDSNTIAGPAILNLSMMNASKTLVGNGVSCSGNGGSGSSGSTGSSSGSSSTSGSTNPAQQITSGASSINFSAIFTVAAVVLAISQL